jgi:DNA polymerase-3 subunit gamma/tau
MSYQVIARKYRPQRFSDVVGQDHVTRTLIHAIEQNRIAHAYLFCGPRGTGKTTIARIFAKCLNCTGGPKTDFDDNDIRCREIAEGRSLDVMEIDAASNRGIEEIRGLRETVKYAPASSKFRVYIIDEVHMLTKEAFNALLKTLEEPPEHVKFMFATTEPEKVLPTILSRCQRFDLRRIPAALIVKHLAEIAAKENVTISESALFAIARGAEGGMRDAESTLDQLISFCGNRIEEADVLSMFGLTAAGRIQALAGTLLEGDAEGALRELNALASQGKDLGRLLSDLLNHFRNLLIFQLSKGDLSLLEVSESEAGVLAQQAPKVAASGLTRILEVLGGTELRLRDAASKKTLLEVALLKVIEVRNALSLDEVLKQLQSLRGGSAGEGVSIPLPASAPAPSPAPFRASGASVTPSGQPPSAGRSAAVAPSPAPEAEPKVMQAGPAVLRDSSTGAAEEMDDLWHRLLEAVAKASPFTGSYLRGAHLVSFDNKVFTIGFPPEQENHLGLVDNSRNQAIIQTKLAELGFSGVQIKFVKSAPPPSLASAGAEAAATPSEAAPPTAPKPAPARKAPRTAATPVSGAKSAPSAAPMTKEDFKNDPLIQKALEIFKGQIVDVRT